MEGGTGDTFFDKYHLGEVVGKGTSLTTRTCTNQKTGQVLAVKILNLSKFSQKLQQMLIKNLKREEGISEELRHNLVVPILEVYYNDSLYYMLQEHMEGADLCLEIVSRAMSGFVYSEAVASHYMKQILEALRYCHSKNIIHRDLRLYSISLLSRENSSPVKLGNFSSAVQVEELESTAQYELDEDLRCETQNLICTEKDKFGYLSSPGFPAPEMVGGHYYGKPVDVWSAGCLLYLLLCGSPPFQGRSDRRDRSVQSCSYVLDNKQWKEVSEEAKTLIRRMLEPTPSRRITVDDALRESWIRDRSRVPKLHLGETVKAMQKFNDFRFLKDVTVSTALDPHWSRSANCSSQVLSNLSSRTDVGLGGAQDVLQYLEDVEALENCDHLPVEVFEELTSDLGFNSHLKLFEGIQSRMFSLRTAYRHESSSQQLMELLDHLSKRCRNSVEDVKALCDLASSPHLQALLQAHDLIASKLNAATALRLADRHDQSGASMLAVNGNFKEDSIPRQTLPHRFVAGDQSTFKGSTSTFEGNNPEGSQGGYGSSTKANNSSSYKASPGSGHFETLGFEEEEEGEEVRTGKARVVHFMKSTEEPLGITLKVNEQKKCLVSRILDGGMIHRHGTLHVGDEICEINGKKVEGETVETLQKLLRDCRGTVAFKVIPSPRNPPLQSEIFVKALFSYDPSADSFTPSQDAGLKFKVGDVLRVVSRDDANWWQARPWDAPKNQPAKLVPSPQLQEMRIFAEDQARKKNAQGGWLTRKRRVHKDKYLAKHNSLFDQLELVTYEEVVRLPYFARKTLVLLGAHGVGRRHIKNMLITHQSHKFAYPIPHTDRPPRPGEEHGLNYFFVPYDLMTSEIKDNQFLEYGTHEGALYGTKLDTIKQIHKQGLIAILDVEPQALKILRTAEFAPFVVFIAAPKNISLMDSKQMERLVETSDMLERTYQHLFDLKIINNEINETIRELEMAVDAVMANPQWVPVGWLY